MAGKRLLLGRSTQSPTDNRKRHIVMLSGQQSKDFVVTARCRIINVGEKVQFSASDLPGDEGGSFSWQTTSNNIRIFSSNGTKITVQALSQPSVARDSEVITVTRTARDGSQKSKEIFITVARISLSASTMQVYGYDDYDTPANPERHHISIASDKQTVVAVKIEGGVIGSDFNFTCDDTKICAPEPGHASATFDLTLKAKSAAKASTKLRVKAKCPSSATFAELNVNVYSETTVDIVIAKVIDTASPQTALKFPGEDYTTHQGVANNGLKDAIVKFSLFNYDSANSPMDVTYNTEGNGFLTYDIAAEGGKEKKTLDMALPARNDRQVRVFIVRAMKSYYYLASPARQGDTTLTVRGNNVFGAPMRLGNGSPFEDVVVVSNNGNIANLKSPLGADYPVGTPLEFPAIAWSGNPIIIAEAGGSANDVRWTIVHEACHTAWDLLDVDDRANIMSAEQSKAYQLRHCPRQSSYDQNVTEIQWDAIKREAITGSAA